MNENDKISFSSPRDFHYRYANFLAEVPTDTGVDYRPATDLWFKSPDRRQYEGVVFAPGRNVPNYFNLWQGLAIKPKEGVWSLFEGFISEVICGGVEEYLLYVLAWLARLFQDPGGERPGTALVLRGKMGSGKGTFANIIGRILGRHFTSISQPSQVTGKFNYHLVDILLAFVDEGFWAGDKVAEGVIKSMVTEPYQLMEAKGKDAVRVENHVNLIIASNHSWVVPAGLEERRFFVLDVADCHRQDNEYFAAIYKQMLQEGGLEAMLFDLLKYDFSKVNLRRIPRTKGLFEQILSSMTTPQKFWFERLKDGEILRSGSDPWPDWVEGELLFSEYLTFCERHNDRYPLVKHLFFIELKKMCNGMEKDRRRAGDKRRISGWRIPCLEECRLEFSNLLRSQVDWDDSESPSADRKDRIPF